MAFGLDDAWSDLKNKVASELDKITSYFKKNEGSSNLYPGNLDRRLIQEVQSKNWNKGDLAYSFQVLDSKGFTQEGRDGEVFQEFKLQINPQNLTQDENFAINITPTQGAIISEHNGIVLRDLHISGTTGINPFRGSTGAKADGRTLTNKQSRTGYEEFHHLRNYFRAYATFKKESENRNYVLTFRNRKDNEILIVEPIRFSMKRAGNRATLYDYDIQLKVIGNFEVVEEKEGKKGFFDSLHEVSGEIIDTLGAARAVLLRSSSILRQIEREIDNTLFEPLRQMDLLIRTLEGLPIQLGDMKDGMIAKFDSSLTVGYLKEIDKNYREGKYKVSVEPINLPIGLIQQIETGVSTVISNIKSEWDKSVKAASETLEGFRHVVEFGGDALNSIRKDTHLNIHVDEVRLPPNVLEDFRTDRTKILALPRSYFEDLKVTTQRISDNAAEFFGQGDVDYNTYAERTQTFIPSLTKQTTTQEFEILQAFVKIQEAVNLLLVYGNEHFQPALNENFSNVEIAFNNEFSLPVPTSVDEIILAPHQTVEDLAVQYLGDYTRWPEIVQLNNLIPPYISETSTNKRIKKPNDRILIPGTGGQTNTDVKIIREDKYNKDLTETEKRLGIDIKLDDNFDFIINNNNDFEVITGGSNAGQAIHLKFNLNRGDLKLHPSIGIGLPVGEKIRNIDQLYDSIANTILQDPRFDKINDFSLMVDGSTILVKLNLNVVENSTPVPITLTL